MKMTWGEFKKYVESQGVSDDDNLSYVDIGHLNDLNQAVPFDVLRFDDGNVEISA